MALKFRLPTLDDVPEAVRSFYVEQDGEYQLTVEGLEDTGALKRSLDHVRRERDAHKGEAARLKAEKEAADLAALKATGDMESLQKSYEDKIKAQNDAEKARIKALEDKAKRAAIDAAAIKLATELSTVPTLMQRIIAERLYVDLVGDDALVRVADATGKPSAASLDDLRKEILANKEYASILIGSKASGGGAGQGGANGGTSGGAGSKKIADMSETERTAFFRADPAAFKQQVEAEKATK